MTAADPVERPDPTGRVVARPPDDNLVEHIAAAFQCPPEFLVNTELDTTRASLTVFGTDVLIGELKADIERLRKERDDFRARWLEWETSEDPDKVRGAHHEADVERWLETEGHLRERIDVADRLIRGLVQHDCISLAWDDSVVCDGAMQLTPDTAKYLADRSGEI